MSSHCKATPKLSKLQAQSKTLLMLFVEAEANSSSWAAIKEEQEVDCTQQ
jgi:hypothetical protein